MHAATLVTAGVILLIRCSSILSTSALMVVFIVGAATAILSGISAIMEYDLKQIVALSTASQMGVAFMFIGLCDVY
jgi:NADH-quinone oxidoreductase subunit L